MCTSVSQSSLCELNQGSKTNLVYSGESKDKLSSVSGEKSSINLKQLMCNFYDILGNNS